MAMTELEQHYNKFNEEKRLDSRHGQVEYITSMKYTEASAGKLRSGHFGCLHPRGSPGAQRGLPHPHGDRGAAQAGPSAHNRI